MRNLLDFIYAPALIIAITMLYLVRLPFALVVKLCDAVSNKLLPPPPPIHEEK